MVKPAYSFRTQRCGTRFAELPLNPAVRQDLDSRSRAPDARDVAHVTGGRSAFTSMDLENSNRAAVDAAIVVRGRRARSRTGRPPVADRLHLRRQDRSGERALSEGPLRI